MINENQLNNILLINNKISNLPIKNKINIAKISSPKIKSSNILFGSPLKKFINNIYNKLEIPKESFNISLYYLYYFYHKNKHDKNMIEELFNNLNIYLFTCIIISLKHLFDYKINTNNICYLMNINYDIFLKTEIKILNGLNWDTSFNNINYQNFKKYLVHHMN